MNKPSKILKGHFLWKGTFAILCLTISHTSQLPAQDLESPPPNITFTEGKDTFDLNPAQTKATPTTTPQPTATVGAPPKINIPQNPSKNRSPLLPPLRPNGEPQNPTEASPQHPPQKLTPPGLLNVQTNNVPLPKEDETQNLNPTNPNLPITPKEETPQERMAKFKAMQDRSKRNLPSNQTQNNKPTKEPVLLPPTDIAKPLITPLATPEPKPQPNIVVTNPSPTPQPKLVPTSPAPTPNPVPALIPQNEPTEAIKLPILPSTPIPSNIPTTETDITDPGLTSNLATAVGGNLLPSISDKNPQDVEEILKELEARTKQATTRQTVTKPNTPKDEHVYENVPLLRVLRVLAEEAGINFIEPNISEEEAGNISFRLQKMTPLEAFLRVAESRGFRVVTQNQYTTLTRPDIAVSRYLITRRYPLKYTDAMWALQSVANLLGIEVKSPSDNIASFPAPQENTNTGGGSSGGGGGGGGGGGASFDTGNVGIPDSPRWTPSLPFDGPINKGQNPTGVQGGGNEVTSIFIDRKSNALVVKASEEEQHMVQKYIQEMDVPEPQIMIEARIVEMSLDDELVQGIDWKKPFGPGDANGLKIGLFPTGGAVGDPINIATFTQSAIKFLFTPTTLFLDSSTAQIIIRNFQALGIGSVVSEPRVMTKTGVPVNLSSTVVENIPVLTPQSNTGATQNINSTSFQSFTTGLAMDVVPRLLANGEVELNINPTVASEIGRTAPTAEIPSGVPIISQRNLTTTATVRSGMTIIIGGLNQFNSVKTSGGIPPLNRLPFLGTRLFGDRNHDKAKRTLLVFVTPRIIYPNQIEKTYVNKAEYDMMLEASRQVPVYQTDPKPNHGTDIRKALPVQRTLNAN